jgi:hypothetical protein
LSAGRFGECEQCAAMIDADQLAHNPEERYCEQCAPRVRGCGQQPAGWRSTGPSTAPVLHLPCTVR